MNFPLIGFGWGVASVACWAVVILMRPIIAKNRGRLVRSAYYSFISIAASFAMFTIATIISWLQGEAFVLGFIVGDVLAVFFLAGQTAVGWLLFLKKYIPKYLFGGVVAALAVVDIALRTAAMTSQNGFVLNDGQFIKKDPSIIVPIIESVFLSLLLLTGLFLIYRGYKSLSVVVRIRYVVTGAIAAMGSLLYLYDNIFIQSSGLSDTVAIVNIVAYPVLAILIFLIVSSIEER